MINEEENESGILIDRSISVVEGHGVLIARNNVLDFIPADPKKRKYA